jgi:hypothetical protein
MFFSAVFRGCALGQGCRATGVRKGCGRPSYDPHSFARNAPPTHTVSHAGPPSW